jgi:hypothetical protein
MKPAKLRIACRSLYEEVLEFRFHYPLQVVPEAGGKDSLHYYLHKYRKQPPYRTPIHFDAAGIPRVWNRLTGTIYRPGYIALYAIGNVNLYLREKDPSYLEKFLKQIDWLERNVIIRDDDAAIWPHTFNMRDGAVHHKAPWLSANVQGLIISALVRGWRITRRPQLLELLAKTSKIFELDERQGGVRVEAEGHIVYTEAPGLPAPGIMDGFMRSLLGLNDLAVEMDDARVRQLFRDGVAGLQHFLPHWDYRGKWSWYSNREYLSPPSYHWVSFLLLDVLGRLTNNTRFSELAAAWNPERLSFADRLEIYGNFLWTKNHSRWRYRTWRSDRELSDATCVVPAVAAKQLFTRPATEKLQ